MTLVCAGADTARLGVAPPVPQSAFPLGMRSSVAGIGLNAKAVYAKKTHVRSQGFSSQFKPEHFY